jgi:hypothetical protein
MLKWILSGRVAAYAYHVNMPKSIEKLTGYRDSTKKNIDNKIGLWFLN